jgi:imidazolonepropionase
MKPANLPPWRLWREARLATLAPQADGAAYGLLQRGALLARGDAITWVGAETDLPAGLQVDEEHRLGGALLTPALVDCHTHLVYAGQRADEFEQRLQGARYEDIARAGGGIRRTVADTRAAGFDALLQATLPRARTLMEGGVGTVEVKSGYGLALEHEARCLQVARALAEQLPLQLRCTFLGAHALPPEYAGRADDYIDEVCRWLPELQARGRVDAVDAFCEHLAFSPAQTRRVFEAARAAGLPVKLHAEQLSDQGGAALAAEFGALSCDHLEHLSAAGIAAMARAGTVAVLLPGAFHFLGETRRPPVQALRAAGVPMAVATDHNPGSSPTLSLPLMLNFACTLFGLTPEEALRGATQHAARALGLQDRGQLATGLRADLALWALDHPRELSYAFGHLRCSQLWVGGVQTLPALTALTSQAGPWGSA